MIPRFLSCTLLKSVSSFHMSNGLQIDLVTLVLLPSRVKAREHSRKGITIELYVSGGGSPISLSSCCNGVCSKHTVNALTSPTREQKGSRCKPN